MITRLREHHDIARNMSRDARVCRRERQCKEGVFVEKVQTELAIIQHCQTHLRGHTARQAVKEGRRVLLPKKVTRMLSGVPEPGRKGLSKFKPASLDTKAGLVESGSKREEREGRKEVPDGSLRLSVSERTPPPGQEGPLFSPSTPQGADFSTVCYTPLGAIELCQKQTPCKLARGLLLELEDRNRLLNLGLALPSPPRTVPLV